MKQNLLQRFFCNHRVLLFVLFTQLFSLTITAEDIIVDGIKYNIVKNTKQATVIAYSYSGSVVIPSSFTYDKVEYSVTSIGEEAFFGCKSLTSITIPNNVTSIGNYAFFNCTGLTSVTIPNSVTSIRNSSFENCSNLTSVVIGNSVTSIRQSAFNNCSALTSVTIPNSVTSIGYRAFYSCSGLTSVTIPNSVTSIGNGAFYGTAWYNNQPDGLVYAGKVAYKYKGTMPSGTNITFEEGTSGVASEAFLGCSGLTSITIPNSVNIIGYRAFSGCSGLTSVTIPNSVTNIEAEAFSSCLNLESVTFGTGLLTIGSNVFNNYTPAKVIWLTNTPPNGYSNAAGTINYVANDQYTSLSNQKVYPFLSSMFEVDGIKFVPVSPSERTCDAVDCLYDEKSENVVIIDKVSYKGINMSVGSVNNYTCYRNPYIKNVNISFNGTIGKYSFYHCTGIITLETGSNVTNVGANIFQGCTALITANIQNKGTIGQDAFQGCTSLTNVSLGESITSIGNYAFSDCSSLENIVIPDAVTSLGSCSFQNCSNLKSIEMGSGVKTILTYAFANCTALPVIIIPRSVTSISNYVFHGCNSLRTVIMDEQKSELSLGSNGNSPLFSSCPLDSVYIGRNIIYQTSSNYGYSPFYRNTSLRSIEITDGETEISDNEFYGCTNLQNVKIGNGVTKIGKWAFSGCSSIDYFSFGSSVEEIGQEAFSDCTAMTRLISHASTPPTCGSQALDDINKWECTLSVPSGCIGYYQQANQWKEFFFVDDDADAPVYLVGDANGNGEVEIGDVTSVLTLMATPEATSYDNKAADANGNGVIEIGDVTTILTIMAGN